MPLAPYPLDPQRLAALVARYSGAVTPALSYGTVRDFCDSADHLPELTQNRDLKDLQRPWAFKTIISQFPPGSRVLEIGAGDPHVAYWLACAGYEVWVSDPYEGANNGPTDYDYYRQYFPQLHIRRELFSDRLTELAPASFDCIYSISVLEHLSPEAISGVVSGIRKFQKPGLRTVHAVDFILKGDRHQKHFRMAELLSDGFGLTVSHLAPVLAQAAEDVETYFLSAESHNLWRGRTAYDAFPMRRVISLQFCTSLP